MLNEMKPITLIVTGTIAIAVAVGANFWNTPEHQRERDLDKKAAYLFKDATYEGVNYTLPDGSKVEVSHRIPHFRDHALELTAGRTSFISNNWGDNMWTYTLFDGPNGDARVLNQLTTYNEKTLESTTLEREQIPDYSKRQKEYEELIFAAAAAKKAGLKAEAIGSE
jgi:hypothetical protein